MWDSLKSLLRSRSGETLWKHVYSDVGVLGNERADALANQGRIGFACLLRGWESLTSMAPGLHSLRNQGGREPPPPPLQFPAGMDPVGLWGEVGHACIHVCLVVVQRGNRVRSRGA